MALVGTIVANLVANTTKFNNGMRAAQNSVRGVQQEVSRLDKIGAGFGKQFIGASKKAFANFGLAASVVSDIAGTQSSIGRAAGAVGNVAGQAALGGLAAGPIGAAAFGAVSALKEFQEELKRTNEIVKKVQDAEKKRLESFFQRRGNVVEKAENLREQLFPRKQTFREVREKIIDAAQQAQRLRDLALKGKGGFTERDADRFNAERKALIDERILLDKSQGVRAIGGLLGRNIRAAEQSVIGKAGALINSAPVFKFQQTALSVFEKLTEATAKWKSQVEGAADAAKEFNKGGIGQFKESIALLTQAKLTPEQRRAGLLQRFNELKDKTGLTSIGDATGPLKNSAEALDEILRVTRENPTEKQVLKVAEEQLKEQKTLADKLARELKSLGILTIKQAQF